MVALWPHRTIRGRARVQRGLREAGMKRNFAVALVLAGCLMAARGVCAQAAGDQQKQNPQPPAQSAPPHSPQDANPFPTDTNNVPVMPSHGEPDIPETPAGEGEGVHFSLPSVDRDPAASPDAPAIEEQGGEPVSESSSGNSNLDSILPTPGDDENSGGKRGRRGVSPTAAPPKETAAEDLSVGKYYLDNKNWRAALSRFQSAMVLAPDEPEVYWGLAESERHLGDLAAAKANYEKVAEYDPDSRHGKEARKALKDPEIANAKPAPQAQQ